MKYPLLLLFIAFYTNLSAQSDFPYQERQEKILNDYTESIVIISSKTDNNKKNLDFYYLTGEESGNAVLVLSPKSDIPVLLFSDEIDNTDYPASIFTIGKLDQVLEKEIKNYEKVKVVNTYHTVFDRLDIFRNMEEIENINDYLVRMRIEKDQQEVEALRNACRITAEGLNKVFREIQEGMTEEQLIRIMEDYFKEQGSSGSSFYQAASGPHSVNIHFGATNRKIQTGDIIVFDIGAWYAHYTADISRTIPVGGEFSKPQREIYDAVLKAQKTAIKEMKPGAKLLHVQKVAENRLINELHELGLVLDVNSEWQRKLFIQHGFYHFIGLHVHDVWYDYSKILEDKYYKPGMIMTMEPGVYFPYDMLDTVPRRLKNLVGEEEFLQFAEQIKSVYSRYSGMGVRIEDDILITKDGNEVLTKDVPKEISEIEKMMQ